MNLIKSTIALIIVVLALCSLTATGQNYKFTNYGIDEGLAQQYVYTINQDKNGYVWIGTGEGLSRFDGIKFVTFSTRNNLAEDFVSASFQDSEGNLWFGHNQGGLSYYDGKKFTTFSQDSLLSSTINCIKEDERGKIWIVSQNGVLMIVDKERKAQLFKREFRDYLLFSIDFTPHGHLLVGTDKGLFLCTLDTSGKKITSKNLIEEIPATKISSIIKSKSKKNSYWVGTSDAGLYELWAKSETKIIARKWVEELSIPFDNIKSMMEDRENNLWITTFGNGLFKLVYSEISGVFQEAVINYNSQNGLGVQYVRYVFEDREGNIWVGKYGGGLAILNDEFFTFYFNNENEYGDNIGAMYFDEANRWFAADSGLIKYEILSQKKQLVYSDENGLPQDKITALAKDNDGFLWVGTESNGIYLMDVEREVIKKFELTKSKLGNSINAFAFDGYLMWIATKGGAFAVNPKTKKQYHYSTNNGLIHNNINHIFLATDGKVYISSHGNKISIINQQEIQHLQVTQANQIIDVVSITEDMNGDLWVATYGNGIYKLVGARFKQITTKDGLKTDYCYSLIAGTNYDLWVGHREGLSKLNITNGRIEIFDKKYGITGDCNLNAVFKDKFENLWFGTNRGAIKYDPKKFIKNTIPPAMNISSVILSDKKYSVTGEIHLDYDAYKMKIEFVGISFKNPENIKYQYILEGYDLEWSELSTNNFASYPKIEDGNYIFKVKACNSDGICNELPTSLKITVSPPYWKTWWFITLMVLAFIAGIYAIILIRDRNHKRVQAVLEQQLDERTREVVQQKEEIEKKNQDITDSITYAQRIQESMLPSIEEFESAFPDSFVYYKPRDIVSGDFYWFSRENGKFMIACADCTGHGVPGAFMSLISSQLFKDITAHNKNIEPGELLTRINDEIRVTLKQHEDEFSFDGMDAIYCEIDLKSKLLKYSGAVRPLLQVRDGEIIMHKSNPHSIGGFDIEDKTFDTHEVQLKKHDLIFMFSDGYPDQFGGPEGKKIKLTGIFDLINKNWGKPMSEQHQIFKDHLDKWCEEESQIDDILFIGFRVN